MKKLISFLLLSAMLLTAFAACTKTPGDPAVTDPADTTAPAETTVPAVTEIPDDLPDVKFDGETIHLWIGGNNKLYIPDEEATDVVSEAIYKRDSDVQERFEVVFDYEEPPADGADYMGAAWSIKAGDRYDIVEYVTTFTLKMALEGAFINLNENKYLDYEKPWWANYVIDNIRIDDRLYAVSGWYDFASIQRSTVMFFNSKMAEDHGVPDLYQLVRDNKWTYDTMMEIAESVADDVNNDGIYDDNDRYGIAGRQDWWFPQAYTAGYQFFTTNEDGEIQVTGMNDTIVDVFETVSGTIFKAPWYQSFYTYGQQSRSDLPDEFAKDRILFMILGLSSAQNTTMREHGEFGILPTPKFSEEMEYGAAVLPYCVAIARTTGDVDTTSIILEALTAQSYKTVRPAYFDIALSYKYVNDPESKEMLDLALSNLYCDFGYIYMDCGLGRQLPMTLTQAPNLASWFQTYEAMTNANLQALVKQFTDLPD